jgi:GNAT superfamily N-acetyltransferase
VSLPDDLVARPVVAQDGPAVIALMSACDATYVAWLPAGWTPPEVPPAWPERFLDADRWSWVAVDRAGNVVAFTSFRPADGVRRLAHVGAMFVHPSRWRQGIATVMLERAEQAMRARGFGGARLWTPEGAPAERLYRALGWVRDGRREWHDWLGLTVVGYEKPLA